ncbi:LamG domain-containing protein [candidate division KSB1 bacterium]|nr:LamG domain-containing protein [candidate division KSB1 bacterium]
MARLLLLQFNEPAGATAFSDSSPYNWPVDWVSEVVSSSLQAKIGDTSARFTNSLWSELDVASNSHNNAPWQWGQSDFTIHIWCYPLTVAGTHNIFTIFGAPSTPSLSAPINLRIVDGVLVFAGNSSYGYNPSLILSGGAVAANQWQHLAVVRSANVFKLYVDGVNTATLALAADINAKLDSTPVALGWGDTDPEYFDGYLDLFEIDNSAAIWTANFTPPIAPAAALGPIKRAFTHDCDLAGYVANQATTLYGDRVAASVSALYDIILGARIAHTYDLGGFVLAQMEHDFSIIVGTDVAAPFGMMVAAENDHPYALRHALATQVDNQYSLDQFNRVIAAVDLVYGAAVAIQGAHPYSLRPIVAAQVDAAYVLAVRVAGAADERYDLLPGNPVAAQCEHPYDLSVPPPINITGKPVIIFNGREIGITAASLNADETSYAWNATIHLASLADYHNMPLDAEFTLSLFGADYLLIVDNKNMDRSKPGEVQLTIQGISPSARLASPRAQLVTKTWGAVMARSAAEEMAGAAIEWNLVDWMISADRLSFTDASPMDVIDAIAKAAGGVVETKPDGSLRVRRKYPVSPQSWPAATGALALNEDEDILSLAEAWRAPTLINRLVITDSSSSTTDGGDVLEYTQDEADPNKGVLRVYPSPWRTTVSLVHTGDARVGLVSRGEVIRTITAELVEFKDGAGQTQYPVYSLTSVVWQYVDLGPVASSLDSKEVSASTTVSYGGYSLAKITYQTRSLEYDVSDATDESIQFLTVE